jgi:hypothetical protein
VHPARLQRWFLEVPEEERLQEYWRRWRSFEYALAAFREGLARTVDSFASAEARLLGVDPSAVTPAEREARGLALAARFVARYWRGRPCQSLGNRRLPKIVTGPYFDAGAEAVHWLDLDARLVPEALGHELADLERRMNLVVRHDHAVDPLLLEDVRERLLADPVGSVSAPLVQRMRDRLAGLGRTGPTRLRLASACRYGFGMLGSALGAAHSWDSSPPRADQENLQAWCATLHGRLAPAST